MIYCIVYGNIFCIKHRSMTALFGRKVYKRSYETTHPLLRAEMIVMQYVLLATIFLVAVALVAYAAKPLHSYVSLRLERRRRKEVLKKELLTARDATRQVFLNLPSAVELGKEFKQAEGLLPRRIRFEFRPQLGDVLLGFEDLVRRLDALNYTVDSLLKSSVTTSQLQSFRGKYCELIRLTSDQRQQFDVLISSMRSKVDGMSDRRRSVRLCGVDKRLFALGSIMDVLAAQGSDIHSEDRKTCDLRMLSRRIRDDIQNEKSKSHPGSKQAKSLMAIEKIEEEVANLEGVLDRKMKLYSVSLVK